MVYNALVQTFLPYPDFTQTARVLDWRRLGKQRAEALTILRCLPSPTAGGTIPPCTCGGGMRMR